MPRLTAEAPTAPIDAAPVEDKRTLVLFLFGLGLLCWPLLPGSPPAPLPTCGVLLIEAGEAGGAGWQLVRGPAGEIGKDQKNLAGQGVPRLLPLVPDPGTATDLPPELTLLVNRPLPINRANATALEMLPGVGPHLAGVILATRRQQGPFTGPDDLGRVPGIGAKTLARLTPLISFESALNNGAP